LEILLLVLKIGICLIKSADDKHSPIIILELQDCMVHYELILKWKGLLIEPDYCIQRIEKMPLDFESVAINKYRGAIRYICYDH
jgi:hypothetical protein